MFIYLSKTVKISSAAIMGLFLLFCISGKGNASALLLSLALHEAGHLLAVFKTKAGIRSFTVLPLGADIKLKRTVSYKEDIFISLCGPFISLLSGFAGYMLFLTAGLEFFRIFAVYSTCYGILNLLPVSGLDGGRALSDVCLQNDAKGVYTVISLCMLFVLWQFGIFCLLYTSFNASLLIFCSYLFYTVYAKNNE